MKTLAVIFYELAKRGARRGLVVMTEDSRSRGRGFEPRGLKYDVSKCLMLAQSI